MMNLIKNELAKNENLSVTENGGLGYATSGRKLVDINYKIPYFRDETEENIKAEYKELFTQSPELAVLWLFFIRDIRGGLGERRLFRICFDEMVNLYYNEFDCMDIPLRLLPLISEYGRYDDLIHITLNSKNLFIPVESKEIIKRQLDEDKANMEAGKPISLLAKWMPRINTSSKKTQIMGKKMCKLLGLKQEEYRKMISSLNKYLNTIEVNMSSNNWEGIDYNKVPSKANLIYSNAFMKHDTERRSEYLNKLSSGSPDVKINASTAYPHEIIHKLYHLVFHKYEEPKDDVEAMWKALPDFTNNSKTIVVADGSGSMYDIVSKSSSVKAIEIACSLAIYFAEHCTGEYKDRFITFSDRPQFVDLTKYESLFERFKFALKHCEVANTNINAVFELILDTAIKNNLTQEDMVDNILIISDMEFDRCATVDTKDFDEIKDEFESNGYKLPRLIFWNVNSRTNTIPLTENELGVALVSGFSTSICDMVLSGNLDPFMCIYDKLMSDRYEPIRNIIETYEYDLAI